MQNTIDFYARLGFRLTEYAEEDGPNGRIAAAWLHRKGNVHDLAITNGKGPRLHHFCYWVPTAMNVLHLCDVMASSGYLKNLERGPGRHGISNAFFLYVRDPDGHRLELYTSDYFTGDHDHEPLRWSLNDPRRQTLWGAPAPRSWFEEGSPFPAQKVRDLLSSPKSRSRISSANHLEGDDKSSEIHRNRIPLRVMIAAMNTTSLRTQAHRRRLARRPFKQLGPQFEKASGHTLSIHFNSTPNIISRINAGTPFDAVVVPVDVFKDAAAKRHLARTRRERRARRLWRHRAAPATPRPDLSTPDAFKKALLAASSIASVPASAAGAYMRKVYEALRASPRR